MNKQPEGAGLYTGVGSPLTPHGERIARMSPEEIENLNNQRRKEIQDRRDLARRTIDDMHRLLQAMKENSLTSAKGSMGQPVNLPLTITLDEPRIEAIVREYMRYRMIAQSVENATRDWELDVPVPQMAGKANTFEPMLGAKI